MSQDAVDNARRKFLKEILAVAGMATVAPIAKAGTFSSASQKQPNPAPLIFPTLRSWQGGSGAIRLTHRSRIVLDPACADKLLPMTKRFAAELHAITKLRLPVTITSNMRAGDIAFNLAPYGAHSAVIGKEGYTLLLDNAVMATANTLQGAFYATRTLLQMLAINHSPELPRGFAIDYPRYAIRSVLLDVARMYLSPQFIENLMRRMSFYKLNTLQLHLNDQADAIDASGVLNYPFVIRAFRLKSDNPQFASLIPADGKAYSHQNWQQMEAVAAALGIDIVPEIDTPGHAAAFTRARPDLQFISTNAEDTSILDVRKPETLAYIESVFDEFLPWFHSRRIHIGGDEVSGIPVADQALYLNSLNRYLRGKGKTSSIWGAEATPEFAGMLDKNIVVEWWSGKANHWGEAGFRSINSPFSMYIIPKPGDLMPPHALSGAEIYDSWDKTINTQYPPIGGQVCLWNDWAVLRYSPDYINGLLDRAIPATSQMFWAGQVRDADGDVVPYTTLQANVSLLNRRNPTSL